MRGGEGFLLVYSITSRRSFDEMRKYRETVDRVRNYEQVPLILVGNKSDLESRREVSCGWSACGCGHSLKAIIKFNLYMVIYL